MSVRMICFCFLVWLHLVIPAQIRAARAQMWATTSAALSFSRSRGKRGEGMRSLTCPAKVDYAWLRKGPFDQDGGEGSRTFDEDGKVDARMQQPSA